MTMSMPIVPNNLTYLSVTNMFSVFNYNFIIYHPHKLYDSIKIKILLTNDLKTLIFKKVLNKVSHVA